MDSTNLKVEKNPVEKNSSGNADVERVTLESKEVRGRKEPSKQSWRQPRTESVDGPGSFLVVSFSFILSFSTRVLMMVSQTQSIVRRYFLRINRQ